MKTRFYAVPCVACAIVLLGPALVLGQGGRVVAWGWNEYGQSTVPAGLRGMTAISAGGDHSLVLSMFGEQGLYGAYLPLVLQNGP